MASVLAQLALEETAALLLILHSTAIVKQSARADANSFGGSGGVGGVGAIGGNGGSGGAATTTSVARPKCQ